MPAAPRRGACLPSERRSRILGAEREPQRRARARTVDVVKRARAHQHAAPLRFFEHRFGVDVLGKRQPQDEPSLGAPPSHARRQMFGQRVFERVAAQAVFGQGATEVRAQVAALEELGEHVLEDERRAEVERLLDVDERAGEARAGTRRNPRAAPERAS